MLVDVGRLEDLRYVRDAGDHVAIGALTRHRDLEIDPILAESVPLLPTPPARSATRRCATAAPSAVRSPTPIPPPTCRPCCWRWVARSWPRARTASGRSRPTDFFTGFLESALEPDELLTEIRVPKLPDAGWSFQKFNRRAQDWAIVGVAAVRSDQHTGVALVNMGSVPLLATGVVEAVTVRCQRRRGRASGPPRAPSPRATSTPPPSTASTSPACWCGGRSRRAGSPSP